MKSIMKTTTFLKGIFISASLLTVLSVKGQCGYCNSYEDFLNGRWEHLDTVYSDHHSKSRQLWWGGNDFTITTGNDDIDKKLKKEIFAVKQADTLFLNCRNLRFEKTRFGNGYVKARRIGERSIFFVNRTIGKDAASNQQASAYMFGILGAATSINKNLKNQVCYVISEGADEKGHITIRMIDDQLMRQMLVGQYDLLNEYYAEENKYDRLLAVHIVPILEKSGLFSQAK